MFKPRGKLNAPETHAKQKHRDARGQAKQTNKQTNKKPYTYTPAVGGVVRILVKFLALSGS